MGTDCLLEHSKRITKDTDCIIGTIYTNITRMLYCTITFSTHFSTFSRPVGWGNRIRLVYLCKGVGHPHSEWPGYDTRSSDGVAPVLKRWVCGIPLHCHYYRSGSTCSVPPISQIEQFNSLLYLKPSNC